MEAALAGRLPRLIEVGDIHADLHAHSTWSDGELSIREMAEAAVKRGHRVMAITDHSGSLGVAGGLSEEDLGRQRKEIEAVREEMHDRIILLQGTEVEIRADGSLDYPDEALAKLDLVIASLHTSLRQPRQQVTERLINAIRNPHVDIIGHPTGRLFPDREGADLDMEAVFQAAAESGVALEINAIRTASTWTTSMPAAQPGWASRSASTPMPIQPATSTCSSSGWRLPAAAGWSRNRDQHLGAIPPAGVAALTGVKNLSLIIWYNTALNPETS